MVLTDKFAAGTVKHHGGIRKGVSTWNAVSHQSDPRPSPRGFIAAAYCVRGGGPLYSRSAVIRTPRKTQTVELLCPMLLSATKRKPWLGGRFASNFIKFNASGS